MLWLTYSNFLFLFILEVYLKPFSNKTVAIFFTIGILTILAAGRWNFGVDYDEYIQIYELVPELTEFFEDDSLSGIHGEYGFLFICSILKTMGFSFVSLFFTFSFFSIAINIYAFKKIKWFFFAAVIIYFSHNFFLKEMGQIRNGLSSALLLLSFYYLHQKQNIKFFFLVLFASLIHQASIVFLLAYIACRVNFKTLFLGLGFGFLLGAIGWLNYALSYAEPFLPNALIFYINSEYFENIGFSNPQTIKQILFILIFLYYLLRISKNETLSLTPEYSILLNLTKIYIISVLFLFLFVEFDIVGRRLASYFSSVEPLMVAELLYLLRKVNKNEYLGFAVFVVLYATVSIIYNLSFRSGFDGSYSNLLFI